MIELTSGATRIGSRIFRPSDGPFAAEPAVEKRLVSAGVARYVYHANRPPDMMTASAILEPEVNAGSETGTETGTEQPRIDEETPLPDEEADAPCVTMPQDERAAESAGDADSGQGTEVLYDADYLNGLTNARLKEIADDMGLNTSAMRKKADYVDAILAAWESEQDDIAEDGDADSEDGEEPPDLGAEDPVE